MDFRESFRGLAAIVEQEELEQFLMSLKPTPELFGLAKDMFRDLWDYRVAIQKSHSKSLELEISKTDKIKQLLDSIVEAEDNEAVEKLTNNF